ncbi:transcriptional regulation of mitochondrial recombination-domain-containing protein [Hypoxylon sp. FL1284]|nr:transcriptional regulation of mitochondrial recombination-domain-containing protein [Hypoxylon sp. FL1284]
MVQTMLTLSRVAKQTRRFATKSVLNRAEKIGQQIWIYAHFLEGLTIYSHTPTFAAGKKRREQISFNGKKVSPAKLRKDYWRPLALVQFPENHEHVGRSVYMLLRECQKLHQLSWGDDMLYNDKGATLTRHERGHKLNNQRANTVADLAAVLGGLGKGSKIWKTYIPEETPALDTTKKGSAEEVVTKKANGEESSNKEINEEASSTQEVVAAGSSTKEVNSTENVNSTAEDKSTTEYTKLPEARTSETSSTPEVNSTREVDNTKEATGEGSSTKLANEEESSSAKPVDGEKSSKEQAVGEGVGAKKVEEKKKEVVTKMIKGEVKTLVDVDIYWMDEPDRNYASEWTPNVKHHMMTNDVLRRNGLHLIVEREELEKDRHEPTPIEAPSSTAEPSKTEGLTKAEGEEDRLPKDRFEQFADESKRQSREEGEDDKKSQPEKR